MKAYIDTSILTAFYCNESGSDKAEKTLLSLRPHISNLVRLEFSSAVAKKIRLKEFDSGTARKILSIFHSHVRDGCYEFLAVSEKEFTLANEWLDGFHTSLRTLDTLHLAVAFNYNIPFYTSDTTIIAAAKKIGVSAKNIR